MTYTMGCTDVESTVLYYMIILVLSTQASSNQCFVCIVGMGPADHGNVGQKFMPSMNGQQVLTVYLSYMHCNRNSKKITAPLISQYLEKVLKKPL